MFPRRKHHGVGAVVSVLNKFIHPSQLIRDKYPNPVNGKRLENGATLRQEVKRILQKDQLAIVFTHSDFRDDEENLIELYAVKKHVIVKKEGDKDYFFDAIPVGANNREETSGVALPSVVDAEIFGGNDGGTNELVAALTGVVDIDDDNEPVPENIPVTGEVAPAGVLAQEWGHEGFCFRKQNNIPNTPARLSKPCNPTRNDLNLQLFEVFFPINYIKEVLIVETNKKLNHPLTYGEFLRWVGLWVLMSTVDGSDRRAFWSSKPINIFEGAPFRLSAYMSRNRFEQILNAIQYTNIAPPQLLDRFWEVRQLIQEWNANMDANFIPSWINGIDESMSKWLNEYTCPGFMCVPRKPWKFGNEYHDAGCCESDIIWQVDLREGKDWPPHLGKKRYDEMGATVGTLLRLTEPVHGTGKVFVLDSGFCVLQALVELKKKGVYAHAHIKKR